MVWSLEARAWGRLRVPQKAGWVWERLIVIQTNGGTTAYLQNKLSASFSSGGAKELPAG